MSRRSRVCTAVVAVLAGVGSGTLLASPAAADPLPPTELVGQFAFTPLPDKARIQVSDYGLRFVAGQQHTNLRVTEISGGLRFVDTGTKSWLDLAPECQRITVPKGVGADCRIPSRWAGGQTMFVEVWPRLGNDVVHTADLGARFRSWVLLDDGNDRATTGAGDDFVNAAAHRDVVSTGAGNDWVRGGRGKDWVDAGSGNDKVVGQQGADLLRGGSGDDQIYGTEHNDVLHAGPGADSLSGGTGRDIGYYDGSDRLREVEVRRSAV